MQITDKTPQQFESRNRECHNTTFARTRTLTESFGFCLSQVHCADKHRPIRTDAFYGEFRPLHHCLARVCHTTNHICCAVKMSAQATTESFSSQNIMEINKIFHVKETEKRW